jgi:hypothetical protein
VIFGETSSTGGLRASPAIYAYVRVSARTSRYVTFNRLTLAGKTSLHPLSEGDENADQMISVDADSGEPVMVPEPGAWYRRGTRLTAVVGGYAYFDGRASAAENFEERTGIARWDGSRYIAVAGPVSSPFGGGALRYVSAIELPAGRLRLYYESATEYGSHELRTELCVTPASSAQ